SKDLFLRDACRRRNVCQDGWRIEAAFALEWAAAEQQAGACFECFIDKCLNANDRIPVDERATLSACLRAVTDTQASHPLGELLCEGVMQFALYQEAVGRRAGLAAVAHLGDHGAVHGVR